MEIASSVSHVLSSGCRSGDIVTVVHCYSKPPNWSCMSPVRSVWTEMTACFLNIAFCSVRNKTVTCSIPYHCISVFPLCLLMRMFAGQKKWSSWSQNISWRRGKHIKPSKPHKPSLPCLRRERQVMTAFWGFRPSHLKKPSSGDWDQVWLSRCRIST